MTREEAIERIEDHMSVHKIGKYPHIFLKSALDMAIAALRVKPTKLGRSRWEGCETCRNGRYRSAEYCPGCGKPLTEEAWAELERRIGGNDETD